MLVIAFGGKRAGVLECWSGGVLECWSVGVLECWSVEVVGVLECWLNLGFEFSRHLAANYLSHDSFRRHPGPGSKAAS
jgi:hypothetical protein